MKILGRGAISDFLGDFVVYRSLIPMDPRLCPSTSAMGGDGHGSDRIPRKLEPAYAEAMVRLLSRARSLDNPSKDLHRIVYIGDTRLNDGRAFANLCAAGGWQGLAFICDEREEEPDVQIEEDEAWTICNANRWNLLRELQSLTQEVGFRVDEDTAVVIDLDKTAFGARGRNDHVIDQIRLDAAREMGRSLVGASFEIERFDEAYHKLNRSRFHSLTADNQDYLVYLCLMLESGHWDLKSFLQKFEEGSIRTFMDVLNDLEQGRNDLSPGLKEVHDRVRRAHEKGDPTPFKAFRRMEYRLTVERMGGELGKASVGAILQERIVLTGEVQQLAQEWASTGALLFGLSDKPDEASRPTPEQAAQGHRPIHQIETVIVGS